jgi:hypothetical protein
MKKFNTILLIFAMAMLVASCEGPMGVPGPPGLDGESLIGSIFEIEGDFTPQNEYKLYFQFPSDFEIYDTDVVLVYMLWAQADGIDIWRLMPQTIVLDEGVLQYNFDYTVADVEVFLEFTVPEGSLLPGETDGQIFRIAVLPADFANDKSVDVTDLNAILKSPQIDFSINDKISIDNITH